MLNYTQINIIGTYMNSGLEEILKIDNSIAIDFLESVTSNRKFSELRNRIESHEIGEYIIEWRILLSDMNSHERLNLSAFDDDTNSFNKASALDVRIFINKIIDDHIKTIKLSLEKNQLLENEIDNNILAYQILSSTEAMLIEERKAREDLERLLINQDQELQNANQQLIQKDQQLDFARNNITIPTSTGSISMSMEQFGDLIVKAQGAIEKVEKLESNQALYIEKKIERAPIKAAEKREVKESIEEVQKRANDVEKEAVKLKTEHNVLKKEQTNLATEHTELKNSHIEVKKDAVKLKTEHDVLKENQTNLATKHTALKDRYTATAKRYDDELNNQRAIFTKKIEEIYKMQNSNLNKIIDVAVLVGGGAAAAYATGGLAAGTSIGASVTNFVGENIVKFIGSGTAEAAGTAALKTVSVVYGGAAAKKAKDWIVGEDSENKGNSR